MERTQLGRKFYELGLRLGGLGPVLIGCGGGLRRGPLARAAGCGAALAGGEVRFHDGSCAACGAWLAEFYGLPASLFVRQEGAGVAWSLLTEGPASACTGEWDLLAGADAAWAAHRAGDYRGEQGPACAQGPAALTLALERVGYEVSPRPVSGAPLFACGREGFDLRVEEGGAVFRPQGRDALAALAAYVQRPQAVPAFRPSGGAKTES